MVTIKQAQNNKRHSQNRATTNKAHSTRAPKNNQPAALTWHTPDNVFKKAAKTTAFKQAYAQESARIEIALALKQARTERNLTQAAVAKKAAMPQSAIARLESGNHSVSFETLSKVAQVLGKQIKLV